MSQPSKMFVAREMLQTSARYQLQRYQIDHYFKFVKSDTPYCFTYILIPCTPDELCLQAEKSSKNSGAILVRMFYSPFTNFKEYLEKFHSEQAQILYLLVIVPLVSHQTTPDMKSKQTIPTKPNPTKTNPTKLNPTKQNQTTSNKTKINKETNETDK